jgi:hypothetical protein
MKLGFWTAPFLGRCFFVASCCFFSRPSVLRSLLEKMGRGGAVQGFDISSLTRKAKGGFQ